MKYDDALLIHMGGLGDTCLSESTFLSLSIHFQKNISALGYSRFLTLFQDNFKTINSIESAKWLYLFSDYPSEHRWKRIIFIGKDRNGELRRRWRAISWEDMIFVDMYPDNTFGTVSAEFGVGSSETEGYQLKTHYSKLNTAFTQYPQPSAAIHIEDYQLAQLEQYSIKPLKKAITPRPQHRVILYPEVSITKSKWHHKNFVELYHALKERGIETYIVESLGLDLPISEKIVIDDLADMKNFFNDGGIFVSNDSGMAHFAGICGLYTITIFSDFNPAVWHPRGRNLSLRLGIDTVDILALEEILIQLVAERSG